MIPRVLFQAGCCWCALSSVALAVMYNRDTGDANSRGLADLEPFDSRAKIPGCSAVLIAPNVLLSAAHCVNYASSGTVTASWNGQNRSGAVFTNIGADHIVIVTGTPFNDTTGRMTAPYSGAAENGRLVCGMSPVAGIYQLSVTATQGASSVSRPVLVEVLPATPAAPLVIEIIPTVPAPGAAEAVFPIATATNSLTGFSAASVTLDTTVTGGYGETTIPHPPFPPASTACASSSKHKRAGRDDQPGSHRPAAYEGRNPTI